MYSSMKCLQAQDVADAVVYVLGAPNYVQVPHTISLKIITSIYSLVLLRQVHDILMRPLEQVY